MAVHGKKTRVYANGYDLTGYLRKIATPGECDTAEASTFGMTSKAKVAGQKSAKLNAEGLFASDTTLLTLDKVDDVLKTALGVENVVWLYGLDGDAFGKRATGMQLIESSYEISNDVADVVAIKVEGETSKGNAAEGGVFLVSGASPTNAAGNSADLDNSTPTTNGAACFLQVPDVVGAAPSLQVKVQHSTDGTTWVDLVTFTAVTADHKAEAIEVAGTVNRHVRALWTFGGTMTAATFAVAIARR